MEIILYSTNDSENVINKKMIEKGRIEFVAKDDINMMNPVLRLRFEDINLLFDSNYAEIADFKRKYFIRDIRNITNNVWSLSLECDVLESFKEDILNSTANVNRKIKQGDYLNNNGEIDVRKEIEIYKSGVTLENKNQMVFSTIG